MGIWTKNGVAYDGRKRDVPNVSGIFASILIGSALIILMGMWGCPKYKVWERGLAGESELKQAEWNRQIAVAEAEAKKMAAISLAQAEVERAKGVAQANEIIGESLKKNEDYLRYLWITEVAGKDIDKTVVYVPTEANVPILEAGRVR